MSVILAEAFDAYGAMRDAFELHRHAVYLRAHEDLRGNLLRPSARARGIDPYSLFMGPGSRAAAHASEDLIAWFAEHGRPTVEAFERDWWAQRGWGQL